jgi:hypothetical protein
MHYSETKIGVSAALVQAVMARSATVGVIGLGYVGLPLATAIARVGFPTIGFDVDVAKICQLNKGTSYIGAVNSEHLSELLGKSRFRATSLVKNEVFSVECACDGGAPIGAAVCSALEAGRPELGQEGGGRLGKQGNSINVST